MWDVDTKGKHLTVGGAGEAQAMLALDPTGKRLATCGQGTVTVWDGKGKLQTTFTFPGHPHALALSAGGKWLAVAYVQTEGKKKLPLTVKLWNLAEKKEPLTLRTTLSPNQFILDHGGRPVRSAFSPNGRILALWCAADNQAIVQLWDIATGKPGPAINVEKQSIVSFAFRPDSKTLACGVVGGNPLCRVQLFDAATGKPIRSLGGPGEGVAGFLAYSPGRKQACRGATDRGGDHGVRRHYGWQAVPGGVIRVWDVGAPASR